MRVACILFSHEVKLAEFAETCFRFSPQIALREPDALFIEIGKCKTLYSEDRFLARVQVLLRRFNYQAQIEIADTLPKSLTFARHPQKECLPRDFEELPLDALYDFGDPLRSDPIAQKSIRKMIEALERIGLKKIGDFRKLPTHQLPSRFGSLGLFCRQQMEEQAQFSWPHWTPPEILSEHSDLSPSEFCSHLEPLLFQAKELLDRVFSRLRGNCLRADRVQFSITLERHSRVKSPLRSWIFELILPQGSTHGFLPILQERLNRDLEVEPLESSVIAMKIDILSSSIGRDAQKNFFHSQEEHQEKMGSFFSQMEEFLGKGHVFWTAVNEHRFPEKSWNKLRNPQNPEEKKTNLDHRYPQRPTRIFQSPIPVTVIGNRIALKKRSLKIHRWSRVERISSDWINETPSRNYYCVELEGGTTLWVFTDPSHHSFIHGYYE